MITSLSKLMMDKFIDMLCGELEVIVENGESPSKEEVATVATRLIGEYEQRVDPSGYKRRLTDEMDNRRRDMKIMLLRLCAAMLELGAIDDVRVTMKEYGWRVDGLGKDALKRKIDADVRRFESEAKREREEKEKEAKKPTHAKDAESIRACYDREVAFVMAHFKMALRLSEVTASVYANLVAQAQRELSIKQKALNMRK